MPWIGDLLKKLTQPARVEVPNQGLTMSAREVASQVPVKWNIAYEFVYLENKKKDNLTLWAVGEDEARRLGREKVAYIGGRIISVSRIV